MPDVTCGYCHKPAMLTTGKKVYPWRPDLADKPMYACFDCNAWVGCHPGTTISLGRLANKESRHLKMLAHEAFDPLWKEKKLTRSQAYKWLREAMGLSKKECHIGLMSDDDLKRAIALCRAKCKELGV